VSGVLLRLALRNLRLYWVRTLIVGLLLILGTWLVVVGNGLKDAVDAGMSRSIIDSLAGHVQVYSADAKDPLELYGSIAMGMPDVGTVPVFRDLRDALLELEEVEAVVPMGVNRSIVTGRTILEARLEALRDAYRAGDVAAMEPIIAHVRLIVDGLEDELDNLDELAAETPEVAAQRADLARVQDPAFWEGLRRDPGPALEFLDNQIGPLGLPSGLFFLTYVGTDHEAFARHFDLFEVVEGEPVPPGQRGLLLNKTAYERFIKHKSARRLDAIAEARERGTRIAADVDLQREIDHLVRQYRIVTAELAPDAAAEVVEVLRAELDRGDGDLAELMQAFLAVDDATFERRYALFYEHIAPRIRLYQFRPGDTLTLYGQTRGGYARAFNVPIYGVFRFRGLERSTLAGVHHLMDLITFRELYGLSNPVTAEEVAELQARSGIVHVERDAIEDELFGGGELVAAGVTGEADPLAGVDLVGLRAEAEAAMMAGFTAEDIADGPVLNAAVILRPGVDLAHAIARIEAHSEARGLNIQARSWRDASGLVGQLTLAIDFPFWGSLIIIYVVALVIINNSLVMATMDRLQEIGTMRAIGAQRGFVVRMLVLEAGLLSFGFGVLGAALGAATILSLGHSGIAASSDLMYFLFGGTHLRPVLELGHLAWAFLAIVVATLLATAYPALIASRVQPVVAMQSKE